ncbi:hypothetical protein LCGC14_2244990 [marine sediment metagenome]|uniref:HTH luxR-type domain-containing protein n=1 Tax=marine sediment metagenome TaxID=412755 RepID=A0A0F9DRX7_9ZZZZ
MLCQDCSKKPTCVELCPEAEAYVSQDHVSQRELAIGLPRKGKLPDLVSNTHLTKKEKEIVTLLGRGLNRADICQLLDMSRDALRTMIKKTRKKAKK